MYTETVKLNDGKSIPQLGLGVWQTPQDDAARVVSYALQNGYRHVDTAAVYENEAGVGDGIHLSGVAREDIFLTTKVWNGDHGFEATLKAFDASLQRLKTDYVDLYLIHWPAPKLDRYVDSWRALIRLRDEGRVKSIGVSNFELEHLERLSTETGVLPALNQVELHPHFQQRALREAHAKLGIKTQAWSPLGQGSALADPTISNIARRHACSPAQVIIRWHLQIGNIVIPKSITPARIVQNGAVESVLLQADDLAKICALDREDGRIGPNPRTADF